MPYNGESHEGNEAVRKAVSRLFGVNVPEDVLERAESMKETHSSFSDPGGDWNRFDFFDADGVEIKSVTLNGY